jgi:hypothetical protein
MPNTRPDDAVDADTEPADDGLQTGGNRGSSNQGGPERSGLPEKSQAARVNGPEDRGSRATTGREASAAGNEPVERPEPPEPLPPGTEGADYVGGEKPHKTCTDGTTTAASGIKNEVV